MRLLIIIFFLSVNAQADIRANKYNQELAKDWIYSNVNVRLQCREDGVYLMFDDGYKLTDYGFLDHPDSQRFIGFVKTKFRKKKLFGKWELKPKAYKGIDDLIEYGQQDCN